MNEKPVTQQSELVCFVGNQITLDINVRNNQATLENLKLSVQFYQDFQNGIQNYRLETRVIMSGPN